MKSTLLALGTLALFSTAFAQQPHAHSSEAEADFDSKPQATAEAKKNNKQPGAVRIKDGGTARGEGSAVPAPSKTEKAGEARAEAREAKPHSLPKPGGTPK
ncbi:hypothetical protein ABL840_05390 [Variovorax sp. NFACC27]|uniref:hypothetical protein n=1 Tax=unclassified Variovorax TaxID=663243 RepID=UPI000896456C|nr:hypothetical protein SAMN03159371_00209 [Variovorax sp. NFACC28]SEF69066.1 hypothetical protein SAMN03159365_00609 [Variovorax sp. NFACC29]SFB75907.1 hypothetical protein SAMN03159379_00608 [Variovorax sp. NFACC26]SFG75600.1 hypothetical protein SAMN03159447_04730 [Variovorax sp. NFACC27]